MQRDDDETEIEAAYRQLSRELNYKLMGKSPNWGDLHDLLRHAYQKRAVLNSCVSDAESALGIKPG